MINIKLTKFVFVCIFLFNNCSRQKGMIIDRIIEPKLSFLDRRNVDDNVDDNDDGFIGVRGQRGIRVGGDEKH